VFYHAREGYIKIYQIGQIDTARQGFSRSAPAERPPTRAKAGHFGLFTHCFLKVTLSQA
jgi:hypothetical protein